MSKRMLLTFVLLFGIGAAIAVAVAVRGAHGSSRAGLFRLSNRGGNVSQTPVARKISGESGGEFVDSE